MALPRMRAKNRGGSRSNGSDRGRGGEGYERPERGYPGMGHGSPFSRHKQGSGPVAGAGMLDTTPHHKPGPAASKYMSMGKEEYPSRGIPSGSTPSGMRGNRNQP
jgi:hypothetical protein